MIRHAGDPLNLDFFFLSIQHDLLLRCVGTHVALVAAFAPALSRSNLEQHGARHQQALAAYRYAPLLPFSQFIVPYLHFSSQKRLRVVIFQQFLSSLCDIFCLACCSPLLFMPWAWASIPPLLRHYWTRHTRPGGENACETWRSPILLLLISSAAEAILLCLCIVCLACPWHWRRIASMLVQVSAPIRDVMFCVHVLTNVEGWKSRRQAIGFARRNR